MSQPIVIFTDGACSGNPGPGGYGSILSTPDGKVCELGGGERDTTNNRMEMLAAIRALELIEPAPQQTVLLYTDSTYMIKGITQWVIGWRSRGWKSAEGKDVANRDLWEELLRQVGRLKPTKIEWKYVRGHAGIPGNERCDVIAVAFAKGTVCDLYDGPRDGYTINIDALPESMEAPERSSKSSSSKGSKSSGGGPTTYLSYLQGVVMRHSTWAACERRVKGRPAKFKKAKSTHEESEILISWGLDPKGKVIDD